MVFPPTTPSTDQVTVVVMVPVTVATKVSDPVGATKNWLGLIETRTPAAGVPEVEALAHAKANQLTVPLQLFPEPSM